VGETEDGLPPLERLLRCGHEEAHLAIADALWDAPSDADAAAALERLAGAPLAGWEAELRAGRAAASGGSGEGGGGRGGGRRGGGGGRGGGRGAGGDSGSRSGDDEGAMG
jgi:tRNA-dihydrouridine synthase 3